MRIELADWSDCRTYTISTGDTNIAAAWLAEHIPRLATLNAAMPRPELMIWADGPDELKAIGGRESSRTLDQEGLLAMAQVFLDASQQLAEQASAEAVQHGVDVAAGG
jgi:hypothetical protein